MTRDADPPDARLLQAWRSGDKAAADALIGRLGPRLYNFFATKVADGAEPLCQRVLAECVEGDEPLGPDGTDRSVRSLVFAAARRHLLEHFAPRTDGSLDPALRSVADLEPGVSELMAARPSQRELALALRHLPVDAQIALELSYWEHLTVQELSRVVQAPPAAVEAQLEQAQARLRALLDQGRALTDETIAASASED